MIEINTNSIENVRGEIIYNDDMIKILQYLTARVADLIEEGFEILDIIYAPDDLYTNSMTVYYN